MMFSSLFRTTEGTGTTRWTAVVSAAALTFTLLFAGLLSTPSPAHASGAMVELGAAGSFSVLGASTVTNTGPTYLGGDLGVSPGTAITGFPPGKVAGTTHSADVQAGAAHADLQAAYNDAAGRTPTEIVAGDLVGRTLTAGVYSSASSLGLSGTLVLDGQGDPEAVFIFQMGSTLTTASASSVKLINGAQASHVFWQVGSSATLGTGSSLTGTVMALASITVTTGVVIEGRALALNGAVTLDSNTITTVPAADPLPSGAMVELGAAGSFSVLGASTVTNTGPTYLGGDLGVSPGTAITGFPPGKVAGTTHSADVQAGAAHADLQAAYDDAAGRTPTEIVAGDLVGRTLTAGVYSSASSLGLSGTLVLDGQGDPEAVFIFQMGSTLTTASASSVKLINGAQASHVFWQVGSSATLGTGSSLAGTVMALASITVTTGVVIEGRALALNGAVTLDSNTITTVPATTPLSLLQAAQS
ncbi:ice-binding family protein [Arthrobacter rhizosphaerae]|uniref:ice-binding family protein n=1 Tax=Arthrobacter rhizosphaerae TaxID=2855490 RepID=UPI001FF4C66B|nr:ice-binding family protein [Arthrobacter rhizosphaerae]